MPTATERRRREGEVSGRCLPLLSGAEGRERGEREVPTATERRRRERERDTNDCLLKIVNPLQTLLNQEIY